MQVFEFNDYRSYLAEAFAGSGPNRGKRILLAEFLACQPSFLSQVISKKAHLSLEHAIKTSEFLNFNEEEKDFFLLQVQKDKAGSKDLEDYFQTKLSKVLHDRDQIKNRIKVESNISVEDQMRYYSTWYYSSIHIFSAIAGFDTAEVIARELNLETALVKEALEFLIRKGLVDQTNAGLRIGSRRIHLNKGSPMLPRHHANWRMRAISAVDTETARDLHYTGVLGISATDRDLLRQKLLTLLEEFEPALKASTDEVQSILLIDLFSP